MKLADIYCKASEENCKNLTLFMIKQNIDVFLIVNSKRCLKGTVLNRTGVFVKGGSLDKSPYPWQLWPPE